ncbi:MAG: glycosyltransferase family 2 protein [Gallionella sp.]
MPQPLTLNSALPITVVIPCYRCGKTIQRAIESIAQQTALPSEILLVDDFSNDDTVNQLQMLAHDYPPGWIRVISLSKNVGAGVARNEGMQQATQDYIAFLDSDDAWHPLKLSIQYNWMRTHSDVMLTGHLSIRYSQRIQETDFSAKEILEKPISPSRLLLSNAFSCRSMMFRRELPVLFDLHKRYMEDQWWLMQIAFAGYAITELKIPLAFTFKADYGEEGLSSRLWLMEKSELENYYQLGEAGKIPRGWVAILWVYSLLKHIKRMLVSQARHLLSAIQ